jgi:hypothetical protein
MGHDVGSHTSPSARGSIGVFEFMLFHRVAQKIIEEVGVMGASTSPCSLRGRRQILYPLQLDPGQLVDASTPV